MNKDLEHILHQFFPGLPVESISVYGAGHINDTFHVLIRELGNTTPYLLQRLNQRVFRQPEKVMANIRVVYEHLVRFPDNEYLLRPIETREGNFLYRDDEGEVWRVFPFFSDTYSPDRAGSEEQAIEAARMIGRFLDQLTTLDPQLVHITIPDFHNSLKRAARFEEVLAQTTPSLKTKAGKEIALMLEHQHLFSQVADLPLPARVVHNDAKISNVLFNRFSHKACSVIDWDTIMPGNLLSDFGDLVRSAAASHDEGERDSERVKIDLIYFEALCSGFIPEIKDQAAEAELQNLVKGALWITLEQALRFLTDFLEGDPYYKTEYAGQNLDRTRNQLALYASMLKNEAEMKSIVSRYL